MQLIPVPVPSNGKSLFVRNHPKKEKRIKEEIERLRGKNGGKG